MLFRNTLICSMFTHIARTKFDLFMKFDYKLIQPRVEVETIILKFKLSSKLCYFLSQQLSIIAERSIRMTKIEIWLFVLVTICYSQQQQCIRLIDGQCYQCPDGYHFYGNVCFQNILYCTRYENGTKCLECIDSFELVDNKCQPLGLNYSSKINISQQALLYKRTAPIPYKLEIKNVVNQLPQDGWREVTYNQYISQYVVTLIKLCNDIVKQVDFLIDLKQIYFLNYRNRYYYRLLYQIANYDGFFEVLINRKSPVISSQVYYYRIIYRKDQEKLYDYEKELPLLRRIYNNLIRLYPQISYFSFKNCYVDTKIKNLANYRFVFFSPNSGILDINTTSKDYGKPGPLEIFDGQNLTQTEKQISKSIYFSEVFKAQLENATIHKVTKLSYNENQTTYNFTFKSKLLDTPRSPIIIAVVGVNIKNGIVQQMKILEEPFKIKGTSEKDIPKYNCEFNYSEILMPKGAIFKVDYSLEKIDVKVRQSIRLTLKCIPNITIFQVDYIFVQSAMFDNSTHQFIQILFTNQYAPRKDHFFIFCFNKEAYTVSLVNIFIHPKSSDYEKFINFKSERAPSQFKKLEFSPDQVLKKMNQIKKTLETQNKTFDIVKYKEALSRLDFVDNGYKTVGCVRASVTMVYPQPLQTENQFLEYRFISSFSSLDPLTISNDWKLLNILQYPIEQYQKIIDSKQFSTIRDLFSFRVLSITDYMTYDVLKIERSLLKKQRTRVLVNVTLIDDTVKIILYQFGILGFQQTFIINMTITPGDPSLQNCYPFTECQNVVIQIMTKNQVFKDSEISLLRQNIVKQFAYQLTDFRFLYMLLKQQSYNKKTNLSFSSYQIGYGNQLSLQGFVITVNVTTGKKRNIKVSGKNIIFGGGVFRNIGDVYELKLPPITQQQRFRYQVKRIFQIALQNNFQSQVRLYQATSQSRLDGTSQIGAILNQNSLIITQKSGAHWIFNKDTPFPKFSYVPIKCQKNETDIRDSKIHEHIKEIVGYRLQDIKVINLSKKCLYQSDPASNWIEHITVQFVRLNSTKPADHTIISMYQNFTVQRTNNFPSQVLLNYSNRLQIPLTQKNSISSPEYPSQQAISYMFKIFQVRVQVISMRRFKNSNIIMIFYRLDRHGAYKMLVDIYQDIRYFVETLDHDYTNYVMNFKLSDSKQNGTIMFYGENLLSQFLKRTNQTLSAQYEATNKSRILYLYQRIFEPFYFTQIIYEIQNTVFLFQVISQYQMISKVFINDIYRVEIYNNKLNKTFNSIITSQSWQQTQKFVKKNYNYILFDAELIDVVSSQINQNVIYRAHYRKKNGGILEVRSSYDKASKKPRLLSLTPASQQPLIPLKGCQLAQSPYYLKCQQCKPGYYKHSDETCVQKIPNCQIQSGIICLKCKFGYNLIWMGLYQANLIYKCQ